MLIVVHSMQLESIIKKSIHESLHIVPENLSLDSRYLVKSQDVWEVLAEFDTQGKRHQLKVCIDPMSGKVREMKAPVLRPTTKGGG